MRCMVPEFIEGLSLRCIELVEMSKCGECDEFGECDECGFFLIPLTK
jgi:hypothetical protein